MITKKELIWSFQLHGMHLRGDAANYLSELLEPLPQEEHKKWVDAVVDAMYKIPLASNEITKEAIYKAAQEVGSEENNDLDNILEVIDIYKIPKLVHSEAKGKYILETTTTHNLHGTAADKTALFMNRYAMIYSRTSNHELFRRRTMARSDAAMAYSLMKVCVFT
ncbi:DNA polymerase epsilon subunit 2 [Portunus trituberculatus]|uniref:DNA polymerase epsilon subunit 2 n=1 Tax=Portunus trituberculatus TaxID=210409 RepID=A0A5B7G5C0_PORTR|nr:DNA polymerase epsilon subunit 2 [Portunus trituberculatus]